MAELIIVKYCAEECARQRSGELSVYDMVNAWEVARETWHSCEDCPQPEVHDFVSPRISLNFIEKMGQLVEPVDNKGGFRHVPIFVSNGWEVIEKAPWERVPEMLEALLFSYYQGLLFSTEDHGWGAPEHHKLMKSAEDRFYYEYENIHPFRDGNGRTGKILYNYLRGTLDNPVMPPNFWGSSNP